MAEDYIRPPLIGREPPSAWVAVWRFRVVLLLGLAVLILGIVLLVHALIKPADEGPPTVGAPVAVVATLSG